MKKMLLLLGLLSLANIVLIALPNLFLFLAKKKWSYLVDNPTTKTFNI